MTILSRNEIVKAAMIEPESCHCTIRVLLTENAAEARCTSTGKLRSLMTWKHTEDLTRMFWNLPIGSKHMVEFGGDSSEDEIVTKIHEGFAIMHGAYGGNEDG